MQGPSSKQPVVELFPLRPRFCCRSKSRTHWAWTWAPLLRARCAFPSASNPFLGKLQLGDENIAVKFARCFERRNQLGICRLRCAFLSLSGLLGRRSPRLKHMHPTSRSGRSQSAFGWPLWGSPPKTERNSAHSGYLRCLRAACQWSPPCFRSSAAAPASRRSCSSP